MMSIEQLAAGTLRDMLTRYINDAAALARGERWGSTEAYLAGIQPDGLAAEIERIGAAYIKRMTAMRDAAPVVRGNTISLTRDPTAGVEPNAPSREDEAFMNACKKQLRTCGYVLARDADMYEQIAKKYPDYAHPARVRGSEARRWIALHDPGIVATAALKSMRRTLK